MKWDGEIEKKPFSDDVERALEVVGKIKKASGNPTGGSVVVYEYPGKWWKLKGGKPIIHKVILDPTNQTELTRYENIADMLKNYSADPNKHNQIGTTLKRMFEEDK